jgi:vacuolar-type H+-ATPase subunit I/STV1
MSYGNSNKGLKSYYFLCLDRLLSGLTELITSIAGLFEGKVKEKVNEINSKMQQISTMEVLSNNIQELTNVIKCSNKEDFVDVNVQFDNEMKERYYFIEKKLSEINVEPKKIEDLLLALRDLKNSICDIFKLQQEKVVQLTLETENLKKRNQLQEKSKLIADLLVPLTKVNSI